MATGMSTAAHRHTASVRHRIWRGTAGFAALSGVLGWLCSPASAHADTAHRGPAPWATAQPAGQATCSQGEFCAWERENHLGAVHRVELAAITEEQCVPLPHHLAARSFANHTDHDITVYQDKNCSSEADFHTYPGGGTYVPVSPHLVRAVKVWRK